MARRMVLVPEDMYRNMIASSQPLSDAARVASAKAEADRVLLRSRKNKGQRRILYAKKLRDFLKIRKEVTERPLKVEISGRDPTAQTANQSTITDTSPTKKRTKKSKRKKKDATDDGLQPLTAEDMARLFPDPAQKETTPPLPNPEPSVETTPVATHSRYANQKEWRERRQKALRERVDQVIQFVRDNGEQFGITSEGRIIGQKEKPVNHSNFQAAIENLINPPTDPLGIRIGGQTPPGTWIMRSRLMKDPIASKMINEALEFAQAQLGRGKVFSGRSLGAASASAKTKSIFKPTLWKLS